MNLPDLSSAASCPDCNSDIGELVQEAPGVYSITVRHDSTCPRYRAMTQWQT